MARTFRVQVNDPLVQGLAGASQSASTAIKLRSQMLADERAERDQDRRDKALDFEIAQKRRDFDRKKKAQQAELQLSTQTIDRIGSRIPENESLGAGVEGPLPEDEDRANQRRDKLRQDMANFEEFAGTLSGATREREFKRFAAEQKSLAIEDGNMDVSNRLRDAVDDGLFEKDPEVVEEMAAMLEEAQAKGVIAGGVDEHLQKRRKIRTEETVLLGQWGKGIEKAKAVLALVDDKDVRSAIENELASVESLSVQRNRDPEAFMRKIRKMVLDDEDAKKEAFRGTQFDTITGEEEAERKKDFVQPGEGEEGISFTDQVRDRADREARGVLDSRSFADIAVVKRKKLTREIEELLSGKRKHTKPGVFGVPVPVTMKPTRENLQALFADAGVDPQSIPPEIRRKLIRAIKFGGSKEN